MWRVLLVEDEPLIAMMLEDEMIDRGYCVAGMASSVESALKTINETTPDFAIVDFMLSDGDCHDVASELDRRDIPFVLLTGATINRSDSRFANVEVLAKPLELDKLTDALARLTTAAAFRPARDQTIIPGRC